MARPSDAALTFINIDLIQHCDSTNAGLWLSVTAHFVASM
jgi:hypothetical protein